METEEKVAPAPSSLLLNQCLKRLADRIVAWSAHFLTGRYWMLKALLFCLTVSVLFVGGWDMLSLQSGYPEPYAIKVQHPLMDMIKFYPPGSHYAKLTYRLTVPVLLHPLGLSADVTRRIVLPALSMMGTCGVILFTCLAAFRITGDRVAAFFMALNVSATYPGAFVRVGFYDSIALAQLTLAMLPGLSPVILGVLVFSASFTDERGFVASGLLLVREFYVATDASKNPSFWNRRVLAVVLGMVGYWLVRLGLAYGCGLTSSLDGTGPQFFIYNIQFWHPGAWFALKGGWLLVFLAALLLWQEGRRARMVLLLLTAAVIVGLGFAVGDVLRSTSYVYPVVFIALSVICRGGDTATIRLYCLLAAMISVLAGGYNVHWGHLSWSMPLLVQLINETAMWFNTVFGHPLFNGTAL